MQGHRSVMTLRRLFSFAIAAIAAVPALASYRISVWVAPWDQGSLSSMQLNASNVDESNPVWYSLESDGRIKANWNAENATWRAAMTGTDLVPTIQNVVAGRFNATLAANVISSANREAHAESIRQLVVSKGFDGIDIDYEALPASSRADFSAFVELLASKLHASGKQLSVTVHAKTSDSQSWSGPGSQDWQRIGAVADSVKIMAYDYHWATSVAGPLTPLDWLDKVATYAEATIPVSKIVIGLPWYGYDWVGKTGATVGHASAKNLALSKGATISYDANGEATFRYDDHTVYFQDATSYEKKVDFIRARHPRINAFAHWRGGNEDPDIWGVIRKLNSTGTGGGSTPSTGGGGATLPAADFSLSGVSTLAVSSGTVASGAITVIPVNGFSSAATVSVEKPANMPATVELSSATVSPGGSVQVKVIAGRRARTGTHSVRIRVASGSLIRERIVAVTITNQRRALAGR